MVDYVEGREKRAMASFRESLIEPTENSLAQAEWVSGRTAALEVDEVSGQHEVIRNLTEPLLVEMQLHAACRSTEPMTSPRMLGARP